MFNHKAKIDERSIAIAASEVIVFVDESLSFSLHLPSAEELLRLESIPKPTFSVSTLAKQESDQLNQQYQAELASLLKKKGRYQGSSSFYKYASNFSDLQGDYSRSKEYLRNAMDAEKSKYIQQEYATRLDYCGEKASSLKIFHDLADDKDLYSCLRIAHHYALDNQLDKSENWVQKAYDIDSSDFGTRMFLGALLLWKGDYQQAVRSFRVAIDESPSSANAYINLAAAHMRLGEPSKALGALRKALAINPYNENALRFYCDTLDLEDKDHEAIPKIEKFLRYENSSKQAWSLLARAHFKLGKQTQNNSSLSSALHALEKQYTFSADSEVCNNIGLVQWKLRRKEHAQRYLNLALVKALKEGSGIETPLYNLCGLLIENREYKQALIILKKTIQYIGTPNNQLVFDKLKFQTIVLLEATEAREEAAKLALKYSNEVSDTNLRLDFLTKAVYFYSTYDHQEELIRELDVEINALISLGDKGASSSLRATNNLVYALLTIGDVDRASELIGILSGSIHNDPYATATLGMFQLIKGNISRGSELYKEAIGLLQNKKDKTLFRQTYYYHLGMTYIGLDEKTRGVRYLRRALEQNTTAKYLTTSIKSELSKLSFS